MSDAMISIRNLQVSFGTKTVVHNLSFDIRPGRTLAVVGESGSGKSVTSLAMMGLLPKTSLRTKGEILFEGKNLLEASEKDLQKIRGGRIGMIFQEPMTSLNPVQRVGDQVREAISYHRDLSRAELDAEALALFEKVGIPDAKNRLRQYPHTFSGGMRQRVMIAMALACNPSVLIADEPTTALDVTIQAQILDLLKELQRETGVAIIFITHDMGVVAEIADDVMVMRRGHLIEQGSVEQIFSRPAHDYTRSLISAVPQLADGVDAQALAPVDVPLQKPILSVRNMRVQFPVYGGFFSRHTGNVHAVEDVSLDIRPGETLGLVGESGSGKSTIGRALINLAPLVSGEVILDGKQVDYTSKADLARLRRDVQMIFQDPFGSLDPRQTIGDAIMEPLLVTGGLSKAEARDKMEGLLARVELDPRRAISLPHEFSGGQRQRICIARALAMAPKLIIADEAVSALDVTIKAQIIDLMKELQEEFNLAYLFISHDMAAVEKICDRVAVMYFGELVEIAPTARLVACPGHDYTRRLLSAVPITHPDQRGSRRRLDPPAHRPNPNRPCGWVGQAALWEEPVAGHLIRVNGN